MYRAFGGELKIWCEHRGNAVRATQRLRTWARLSALALTLLIAASVTATRGEAQASTSGRPPAAAPTGAASSVTAASMTGRELFVAACANCHGADGRGAPKSQVGFDVPLPDFTDCNYATRENAQDWFGLVHEGGPVRAFSTRMPAFGEALTTEQIERVVAYVRSICGEKKWPRGELNLPRAHLTEKAFPEDESVYTTSFGGDKDERSLTVTYIYEKRLGARTQYELQVPMNTHQRGTGVSGQRWTGAHFGDVSMALKRVLYATPSLTSARILSGGLEMTLPSGDASAGTGAGTPIGEPFLLGAQMLGPNAFVQFHGGMEFPFDQKKSAKEGFARFAIGRSFVPSGFGRTFTPMAEFEAVREFGTGRTTEWSWVPQMQVSLSRRQHIQASAGVRFPMNAQASRSKEFLVYLLWDWFDGGFWEGWR